MGRLTHAHPHAHLRPVLKGYCDTGLPVKLQHDGKQVFRGQSMERLLQLAWICLSLTNIEGAIENRGQTLFFFWQSDPRAQWRWIKSELNLAKAVKRDKTIGCREEKGGKKGEEWTIGAVQV